MLTLIVRAKQQSSGSLQHITYYDAELELCEAGFEVLVSGVEVASADPMDPFPEDVEAARLAILEGAREVIEPLGYGARIRVTYMLLHPVDFQPKQFRRYTALEIGRLLQENCGRL